MKLIEIQKLLRSLGLSIFTTHEFRQATGFSWRGARKFLLRYTQAGVFWQLRRGYYAVCEPPPHPWLIANILYRPSYVSLESALSHYGLIPESIYAVTSVTTRITREFETRGTLFLYHRIKPSAYTGYRPLSIEGKTVLVAEREKALADYLYFVHLGKKELNERLRVTGIQKKLLVYHLKLFQRKNLLSWSENVVSNYL